MMETLRTKKWRQFQRDKHYIEKLKLYSNTSSNCSFVLDDGTYLNHPTWKDLYDLNWQNRYKSVNTPCSCILCSGEHYKRSVQKKLDKEQLELQLND